MKNWQWAEIGTWRRRRALESERTWYGGEGLRRCRCTNSVAASRVARPVPENAAIELPASRPAGLPAFPNPRYSGLVRAFVYWKLRQFVRHQTAAISHALRRHFPLAPLWRLSARARQFSNNFRVEDAKIVSNIRRDCSLAATENLFALIIQSYVFEQSMIYLKIISFNIANY